MDNVTLARVAGAVTDEPVKLEVDINPRNSLHAYAMARGWMPKKKIFMLTGVKMGTLIRVSRILLSVDISFFNSENLLHSNFEAIEKYGENLAECVALCMHNKESPPPRGLVHFILMNFTTAELYRILGIVLRQMDVGSFMSSIISISGVNVLAPPKPTVSQ